MHFYQLRYCNSFETPLWNCRRYWFQPFVKKKEEWHVRFTTVRSLESTIPELQFVLNSDNFFLHYLCKCYPQVTVIEKPVLKIYIVFIRQKVSQMSLYNRLAWKPSVTRGNHRYSRSLPALGRKLRFGLFFSIKVDPLNLESLNQAKNIPVGLASSPITIWCTIV